MQYNLVIWIVLEQARASNKEDVGVNIKVKEETVLDRTMAVSNKMKRKQSNTKSVCLHILFDCLICDFCLNRSHYTGTDPTSKERAVTRRIKPTTSSPGVTSSTNWGNAPPCYQRSSNFAEALKNSDGKEKEITMHITVMDW